MSTAAAETRNPPGPVADEAVFLAQLGRRVREARDRRGLSRKLAARQAEISERHLASLEAGEGNISVALLRRIAMALDVPLADWFSPESEDSVERRLIRRFLERLPQHRLEEIVFRLMREFGQEEATRKKRLVLLGLRGAGKTTLGSRLARETGRPFVELDREIESETGMPTSEIFALYGQAGYRRVERRCLERVLRERERAVLCVGGGIVAQPETYDYLLSHCYTIWLSASPEEHMARVVAQGDLRPMAGNDEAMEDLRQILEARHSLYSKADQVLDTSGKSPEQSFQELQQLLPL